jgi:hypothetical protein
MYVELLLHYTPKTEDFAVVNSDLTLLRAVLGGTDR